MATGGHVHPNRGGEIPHIAWGLIALIAALVAVSWVVTAWTAVDYTMLLMMQVAGAAPTETLRLILLSGVMMVARMLPSALPMVAAFRGITAKQAGAPEARLRTGIFTAGYFLVWTLFAALALVILAGVGAMGRIEGPTRFLPGILLIAMGIYQLTAWKQFCLGHCRSPMAFVMTDWRSGRKGALRMGLAHAWYCLGCCWLLMLVLFAAGAMSLLWMAGFSGLILGEKVWSKGEVLSKGIGVAGMAVGTISMTLAAGLFAG